MTIDAALKQHDGYVSIVRAVRRTRSTCTTPADRVMIATLFWAAVLQSRGTTDIAPRYVDTVPTVKAVTETIEIIYVRVQRYFSARRYQ